MAPSGWTDECGAYDFSAVPGFQPSSFDDCANYGTQFWS